MTNKRFKGILIFIWVVLASHFETAYFGYNWIPKTLPELNYDLTILAIGLIGLYFLFSKDN